ncbi:hypothetical protein OJAV_G00034470 [Oryzias javanicus]|uniref:TGFBR3/Endoglin-like N-terminal domain-containing protein n=1 Tax=Oryzias javanicus TaxID=123683 RepID=A0A3S2ULN8_ORYJA|nr:hypothetical protein OJAV_G00034470 [Oryzias javanicus]
MRVRKTVRSPCGDCLLELEGGFLETHSTGGKTDAWLVLPESYWKLQDKTMGQRSYIPALLLAAFCLTSAGPLSHSPCELQPVGTGHPVQAIQINFTALSGCASRGTANLPQEVHIINLRGHASEGAGNTSVKVELDLKPIHSMQHHQKPLVFVLNSLQRLTWNVKAENLALNIKHIFHVSSGSEVYFKTTNFSLSTRIIHETLPHGNEHLLRWAQKKYRAVTSFSELRMAKAVFIRVGEDSEFSDTCKIDQVLLFKLHGQLL